MLYQSELRVVPRDSDGAIRVIGWMQKGSGHRGARTPDPGLIRPMLYHLSYATTCGVDIRTRDDPVPQRSDQLRRMQKGSPTGI